MKRSTLGSCIRSLRMQNNMTQLQLAALLGVTDKAVSKWERDLSYPDIALFPQLADILGTTVDGLLRECEKTCRPSRLLRAFGMSRDIRLPLHIILGYVEIIRNNHEDPEMLQKYLDGIKISGEYLMSLFDQLMQAKSSGGREDTGDGCAALSGDMEKDLQERLASGQGRARAFSFRGKRILIADDMEINREIAAEILKQTGAAAEFAEDGQICLEMVASAPAGYYDMILMDVLMPRMDGLEATRRIRRLPDPAKAGIPIIAMTTNVSEKDRSAALAAGMDAFEEKPIFTEKLFATIGRFL